MRIILPHDITEHWLWSDPIKFQWWILLLQQVSESECKVVKAGKTFVLRRGEILTSKGELAKLWHTTPDCARSFLRMLESHGEIIKCPKVDPKLTQLKVLSLDSYIEIQPEVDPILTQSEEKTDSKPNLDPMLTRLNNSKSEDKNNAWHDVDPKLTQTEKEKRKEKESSPPHPPYKEKENKKEKEFLAPYGASSSAPQDDPNCGIDFKRLVLFFNQTMKDKIIPQIRDISGKRKVAVLARCKTYGKEAIMEAIVNAAKSSFLNGNNKRNFRASFDWIFAPNNFPKVLEGNFADPQNNIPTINHAENESANPHSRNTPDPTRQRNAEFADHIMSKIKLGIEKKQESTNGG